MPTAFDKLAWNIEHTCKAITKFQQLPNRFTLQLLLAEIDVLRDLAQTCIDSLQHAAIADQITYASEHGYSSPVLTTYTLEDGKPVSATALFPDGSTESASDALEAQSWFEYDSSYGSLVG